MSKKENHINIDFYIKVTEILKNSRQNVLRSVNQTMVYTYYEIGKMIVEEKQNGNERAAYGKQLIIGLSKKLKTEFGKGFSQRNLEQMRQFYLFKNADTVCGIQFELVSLSEHNENRK